MDYDDLVCWGNQELIEEIFKLRDNLSEAKKLLQETHLVLGNYWFDQRNDSYNNEDVIAVDNKVMKFLGEENE